MLKGYQNGTKIDAKTYQISMPKQVAKKIMKLIQNHLFWYVKTYECIVKTMVVEGLAGCARDQKRYQKTSKMISKSVPKSMKINTSSMMEKDAQNDAKSTETETQSDSKIHRKLQRWRFKP